MAICECSEPGGAGEWCTHCGHKKKSPERIKLESHIDSCARAALADGIEISDAPNGAVHKWVLANVITRNVCATVWLIAWRMDEIRRSTINSQGQL